MTQVDYKILNRNTISELIGDEPELVQQFYAQFMEQSQEQIQIMLNSYNQNNFSELKESAHFLKTSAKAIGAEMTSRLLEQLEIIALEGQKGKCKELILSIHKSITQVNEAIYNEG